MRTSSTQTASTASHWPASLRERPPSPAPTTRALPLYLLVLLDRALLSPESKTSAHPGQSFTCHFAIQLVHEVLQMRLVWVQGHSGGWANRHTGRLEQPRLVFQGGNAGAELSCCIKRRRICHIYWLSSSRIHAQVYSLSLDGWVWKEHTAGKHPSPICLCVHNKSNAANRSLHAVEVEGEPPSPRSGHSTVALPGDRHLLVFGGGFVPDDIFYSNVAILDTFTWTWSSPPLEVHRTIFCIHVPNTLLP